MALYYYKRQIGSCVLSFLIVLMLRLHTSLYGHIVLLFLLLLSLHLMPTFVLTLYMWSYCLFNFNSLIILAIADSVGDESLMDQLAWSSTFVPLLQLSSPYITSRTCNSVTASSFMTNGMYISGNDAKVVYFCVNWRVQNHSHTCIPTNSCVYMCKSQFKGPVWNKENKAGKAKNFAVWLNLWRKTKNDVIVRIRWNLWGMGKFM